MSSIADEWRPPAWAQPRQQAMPASETPTSQDNPAAGRTPTPPVPTTSHAGSSTGPTAATTTTPAATPPASNQKNNTPLDFDLPHLKYFQHLNPADHANPDGSTTAKAKQPNTHQPADAATSEARDAQTAPSAAAAEPSSTTDTPTSPPAPEKPMRLTPIPRAASAAKKAACSANGRQGAGKKSEAGAQASSWNAFTHGKDSTRTSMAAPARFGLNENTAQMQADAEAIVAAARPVNALALAIAEQLPRNLVVGNRLAHAADDVSRIDTPLTSERSWLQDTERLLRDAFAGLEWIDRALDAQQVAHSWDWRKVFVPTLLAGQAERLCWLVSMYGSVEIEPDPWDESARRRARRDWAGLLYSVITDKFGGQLHEFGTALDLVVARLEGNLAAAAKSAEAAEAAARAEAMPAQVEQWMRVTDMQLKNTKRTSALLQQFLAAQAFGDQPDETGEET